MTEHEVQDGKTRKQQHEDIPWTVARCNRLLRSISSRIATIRRLAENFESATLKPLNETPVAPRHSQTRMAAHNALLPYMQSPQGQDPEWMPQAKNRHPRTYGAKSQSRKPLLESKNCTDSSSVQLGFRTPFLRKLLQPLSNESPVGGPTLDGRFMVGAVRKRNQKSRQLPIKTTTTLGEAQRGLVAAFSTLLNSTKPVDLPARKGTRSFRSMCLKQVPQFIEVEQAWLQEQYDDSGTDATDQTYTFLESLGHSGRGGFAGLREVVRSHGMRIVIKAIQDGLLREGVLQELVETCHNCEGTAEGQALLQALLQSALAVDGIIPLRTTKMLVQSSNRLGSTEHLFRHLAHLLEAGVVQPAHIAGFGDTWRSLLRTLAMPKARLDAMEFLEAYTVATVREACCQVKGQLEGRSSTLQMVATLLTAMIWMQAQEAGTSSDNGSLAWQLERLLHSIDPAHSGTSDLGLARPFILGALLVNPSNPFSNGAMSKTSVKILVDALSSKGRSNVCAEDIDFLPEVAKVVAHVDHEMASEMMKAVVLGLAKASSEQSTEPSAKYLKSLAVDGAMAWAEDRDDIESYDWAEEVEDLFSRGDAALQATQTPASRKPTKYRWEAGMCEWIQATPFTKVKSYTAVDSESPAPVDDSGICIPTSEHRGRKRSLSERSAGADSDSDIEDDSDLENRDELSMQTPELVRLRDQRARKARNTLFSGDDKENMRPMKQLKRTAQRQCSFAELDDLSEDELGL